MDDWEDEPTEPWVSPFHDTQRMEPIEAVPEPIDDRAVRQVHTTVPYRKVRRR